MRLSRNGSDGRSLSSGKRSSPTTKSISSCALLWNSGYRRRASKKICKVLEVCRNQKMINIGQQSTTVSSVTCCFCAGNVEDRRSALYIFDCYIRVTLSTLKFFYLRCQE